MKYKGKVSSKDILTKEELFDQLSIKEKGVVTDFNWLIFEDEKRQKEYYLSDSVLLTKINVLGIERYHRYKKELITSRGNVCRSIFIDKDFWESSIVNSTKNGLLKDVNLHINPINNIGSGSWCIGDKFNICGYSRVDNYLCIDPLTLTNDYGWRPLLEMRI